MIKFQIGQCVATPAALAALKAAGQTPTEFLDRHMRGDWGTVDKHDAKMNDLAMTEGSRILSAYILTSGVRIWILTEADRSSTCILLSDEY